MKKKCIISLIVIFALTLTSFTAFAANKDELLSNDNIFICEDSNGIYKASKTGMSSETIKILPDTQFDNIYSTPSKEQYYQKIDDNEFIKVSKVEFDLTDYDAYTNIQKYSIPNEVLEGIASMAAFAEETNSKDAQGVIFVSAGNERSGGLNTYPVTTTTWNGKTFHHYQVYFTNMWTSWQTVVQKGSTTEAALKAIKELAVTA
ncbi:MAG: hypothetical protein IKD83_01135, partial [Firmicutes bacterium]|nr:hypothetical protein [Bacillota bacterium]